MGEGSKLIFSGNPSNPQLDVTAKYRVTANLRDLFGDDASQLATSRSNIPVLTCLHMTGPLNNPILSFSLEFPLSDQAIQQQVRQIINTKEHIEFDMADATKQPNENDKMLIFDKWCGYVDKFMEIIVFNAPEEVRNEIIEMMYEYGRNDVDVLMNSPE